jgi:hypothetical protein
MNSADQEKSSDTETSKLIQRLVHDEIAGKKNAVHAYDRMIWVVRTGFLTLLFAGWGLLLSSLGKSIENRTVADVLEQAWPFVIAMFAVSMALAIAGFVVDQNYVRRKFRVIAALNDLMEILTSHEEKEVFAAQFVKEKLQPLLKVSGDSGSRDYEKENVRKGYSRAMQVTLTIYVVPLVGVFIGLLVLSAWR